MTAPLPEKRTLPDVTIRHDIRPGDLGAVIRYHGLWYAPEFRYNYQFEGYVAQTIGEFSATYSPDRDRLWIAEVKGEFVGSIAIVERPDNRAQLRWFLLHEQCRGQGLGKRMVELALDFCRQKGFDAVYLTTTNDQKTAHHLYLRVGFRLTEEKEPTVIWSQTICEQRYELTF